MREKNEKFSNGMIHVFNSPRAPHAVTTHNKGDSGGGSSNVHGTSNRFIAEKSKKEESALELMRFHRKPCSRYASGSVRQYWTIC